MKASPQSTRNSRMIVVEEMTTAATDFLLREKERDGHWVDFGPPTGPSNVWVTAYVDVDDEQGTGAPEITALALLAMLETGMSDAGLVNGSCPQPGLFATTRGRVECVLVER